MNNKGKSKVIAVCLAGLDRGGRSDFIQRLYSLGQKNNFKLLVFNSFADFKNNVLFDKGAKAVYDVINYNIVDGIVVLCNSFRNKSVWTEIVKRAKLYKRPVVLVNGEMKGCYSVLCDYSSSFKELVNHIISFHGIKDTYLVCNKNNEKLDKLLELYKQTLFENGLDFDDSRLIYDDVCEMTLSKENSKKAFICINKAVARKVCSTLAEKGIGVPDNALVTSFNDDESGEICVPRFTSCDTDREEAAGICVEILTKAFEEKLTENTFSSSYCLKLSQSCGCKEVTLEDYKSSNMLLYRAACERERYEDREYELIEKLPEINDFDKLCRTLRRAIPKNSCVCLNGDFYSKAIGDIDGFSEKDRLVVVSPKKSGKAMANMLSVFDFNSQLEKLFESDSLLVVNSVYAGETACGFYVFSSENVCECKNEIKRTVRMINLAVNSAMDRFDHNDMKRSIENAVLVNYVSGLPNLKGASKWFEEFSSDKSNHEKFLTVSVYGIPKYTYIYENYGIKEIEEVVRFVAKALSQVNNKDCFVGHIAEDEFVIINYYDDGQSISDVINTATSQFFPIIDEFNNNKGKEYFIEVNCGCTVVSSGWKGRLESFVKFANSEMYMNRLKMGMGAAVKEQSAPKDFYKSFEVLVEKNLFSYHFQPIVNTRSGEVVAFEALMRTDESISMTPREVLNAAKEYKRLYEVERATMFNVMERYSQDNEKFKNKKVFINTIPGYFLTDEDRQQLVEKYSLYMKDVVFEITEQGAVSDEELEAIRQLCADRTENQIAIDDYGMGHSNIVNLMRYAPKVIKVDRFLINEIHRDRNKQMFVRSTVEFARMNNIKVLAEGVETSDELCTVIELGVDLVQGFYTGKPLPEPVCELSQEIRNEILKANPMYLRVK